MRSNILVFVDAWYNKNLITFNETVSPFGLDIKASLINNFDISDNSPSKLNDMFY